METEYYSSFSFLFYCLTTILIIFSSIKLISLSKYSLKIYQQLKKEENRLFNFFGLLKDLSYSFVYPKEIYSIIVMKLKGYFRKQSEDDLDQLALTLNDLDFCYATLNKVSRSFAVVIEELPECLKDIVCIFYLILRALDTIEDDMNYAIEKKISFLRSFHQKLLIENFVINNIGETKDCQSLLKNFNKIINVFKSFPRKYQQIIIQITEQMGNGMTDFLQEKHSIETIESYNLYCHYVAGLVGDGLSQLFDSSSLENNLNKQFSNDMGLFLQKTNIVRDYFEDIHQERIWWPKQIWSIYSSDIHYFLHHPEDEQSLQCLNHMILNSLEHLPRVICYLEKIENVQIFQFCSIPQVMALATLSQLYNNPRVFTSIVKIRKGLSCRIILNSKNIHEVYQWFHLFLTKIEEKIGDGRNSIDRKILHLIEQMKEMSNLSL